MLLKRNSALASVVRQREHGLLVLRMPIVSFQCHAIQNRIWEKKEDKDAKPLQDSAHSNFRNQDMRRKVLRHAGVYPDGH